MKDPGLRSVSLEARGLWIDMLCLLFESGRRGYLQHSTGKPVSDEQLARMTGSSSELVSRLLQELEDSGVFSRTEHGTIYSKPTLKGHSKGDSKGDCKGGSKQKPTPSSSTSFSSSSSKQIPPLPPEGGLDIGSLFLIFWECYPLKVKKPKALAAFLKLKPDRALLDRMIEAIERWKQSRAWRKENGQYIPHPTTWLNNRQWEDEIQPDLAEGSVWDEFIGEPEKEES